MTKEADRNYTEAQEATIEAFATANGGTITNDNVATLADTLGKGVRSVRAKAVRMGVYKAKEKVSKNGGPVESKEAIVNDIAALIGANMEGLEKAPKVALQRIRSALDRD
jgi:hypothetical protein